MKVLMISGDSSIARVDSEARGRMREYSAFVEELHVVVANAASEKHGCGQEHHEGCLHVYPTCSRWLLARPFDAFSRAKQVIAERGWSGAPDVLVTTQDPFELGVVGALLCKEFRLKFQPQIHVDFLSPFFSAESILNRVRAVSARYVLRRAERIRVVSERIAASLVAAHIAPRKKIDVLPIWVDCNAVRVAPTHDFRTQFSEFKKIILMASRLTHEKQTLWACAALRDVCERTGAGIIVLGDGPELAALASMPHVRTLGWVGDTAPYLKGTDLFVNASLYEGYGRTLVQAAAAGTQTITTDVGVAREYFASEAIASVGDGVALAGAVEHALTTDLPKPTAPSQISKEGYLKKMASTWAFDTKFNLS